MFKCEYCGREFKRENTLAVHTCEPKRRHLQKNDKSVQLGFRAYQLFYKIGTNSKADKTYDDFVGSQYYSAFCKFGTYCTDLRIDDISDFTEYLLKNQIRLDHWGRDTHFRTWIKSRLKRESADRALERTILFLREWGEENNIEWNNYFTQVPTNVAVFHICSGKISPWLIYSSSQAESLISKLNQEQINMILDYIDPDSWKSIIKKRPEDYNWVGTVLEEAGLK